MAWAAAGPSATAFAYGGRQLDKSYTNDRNNPRNNSPQKNGGITEFVEVWILWMCFFSENGILPIDIIPISVWR